MIQEYSDVLTGVGKLNDFNFHSHIDQKVKPVVQPTRRIPFAPWNQTEVELKRLEDSDIIEPATGPTPWGTLAQLDFEFFNGSRTEGKIEQRLLF